MGIGKKIWFFLLPVLAIALHYSMSGILLYGFYSFFLNVLHLTQKQFDAVSGWAEIFVNFVLIVLFFAVYRQVFPRDSGERSGLPDAKLHPLQNRDLDHRHGVPGDDHSNGVRNLSAA